MQGRFGDDRSLGFIAVDVGDLADDFLQSVFTLLHHLFIAGSFVVVQFGFGCKGNLLLFGDRFDRLGLKEGLLMGDDQYIAHQHRLGDLGIEVDQCLGWDADLVCNQRRRISLLDGVGLFTLHHAVELDVDALQAFHRGNRIKTSFHADRLDKADDFIVGRQGICFRCLFVRLFGGFFVSRFGVNGSIR